MSSFNLDRFVQAQEGVYETALAELQRGTKRSHWMWFIFPQLAGLGSSEMSRRYAIASIAEAQAFLDHPILGKRLREAVGALQDLVDVTAEEVLSPVDAQKLRSSLTLFDLAEPGKIFGAALDRWFDGERDTLTLGLLARQ